MRSVFLCLAAPVSGRDKLFRALCSPENATLLCYEEEERLSGAPPDRLHTSHPMLSGKCDVLTPLRREAAQRRIAGQAETERNECIMRTRR